MPKIKKPPPAGILDNLVRRCREGRVSSAGFLELKWHKRFKPGTLAGVRNALKVSGVHTSVNAARMSAYATLFVGIVSVRFSRLLLGSELRRQVLGQGQLLGL